MIFFSLILGSGSSGRMSTISGCSVGDSGTQSDPEDRKVLVHDHHHDTFTNELKSAVMNLNYQTVPAPKPVKLSTFALRSTTFETIEVCKSMKKPKKKRV